MSTDTILDNPLYLTLQELKQAVEAFTYLAENTPDNDADHAIKNVLARRLGDDFEKHYLETLRALHNAENPSSS